MNVLVACEESQRVCTAFRERGHEAYSCDVLECSGGKPEWHIRQDVIPLLNGFCEFSTCDGIRHHIQGKWDLIIAHPPCTNLCSAGQHWFSRGYKDPALREEAFRFFMKFINADCERIAVENPVGIVSTLYRKYDQATCEDYISLLSCEQYRKYRHLLTGFTLEWLITPKSASASTVCYVDGNGNLFTNSPTNNNSARPALILKSEIFTKCRGES